MMHTTTSIIIFSLFIAVFADNDLLARHEHRHQARHIQELHRRAAPYKLVDMYKGKNFFDDWNFFTAPDPTHGLVEFVSKATAEQDGLAYVDGNGTVVMAVDSTHDLAPGVNRASVRIGSKKSYDGGLFIADLAAAPYGCSVWPAWWSVGPGWPDGGEIDVLEGVNMGTVNQYTLHTSPDCTMTPHQVGRKLFTGNPLGLDCTSANGANAGCAIKDSDTRSFGPGFNQAGGGVFAHTWDHSGIKIWHFPRSEIPDDITSGHPDPSKWPTPSASYPSQSCDIASHFYEHELVFDITVCGDWAGNVFPSQECPGTCKDAVTDHKNFVHAKFKINYVAVYNNA